MRRRIWVPLLVCALAAGVAWLATREGEPAAPEKPKREMAGPGYLPEEAPLTPPPAPAPRKGAQSIDFDLLAAFDYDPEVDLIPDHVLALDGELVELRGVMYYAVEDPDRVTDFYSMPNHMICCFGVPRPNEVVQVFLKPETATQYVLDYYLIRGKLLVGAVRDEQDRVLCLYTIEDAEVEILQ